MTTVDDRRTVDAHVTVATQHTGTDRSYPAVTKQTRSTTTPNTEITHVTKIKSVSHAISND